MVDVRGVRLGYDEAGTGPAVVLSHAGIANRRMWEHQIRHLSTDHRVIRYDWRGYGESADAAGQFAHYDDLLGLMDALDVEKATLVGCSMGGAYALDAALAAPDRVSALALICSGLSGHTWPAKMLAAVRDRVHSSVPADRLQEYNLHRAERIRTEDVLAMAEAQARFMVAGPDRDPAELDAQVWSTAMAMLTGVFERLWTGPNSTELHLDPPAKQRLPELRMPTLVITGLNDVPWIRDVSELLVAGIARAQRLDIPHCGHLPPLEHPQRVTDALGQFVAATSSS